MRKILIILGLLFAVSCQGKVSTESMGESMRESMSERSSEKRDPRNFRIMFYNVENLFDTEDNPNTRDDDFLPRGTYYWNESRYWQKLNNISKVITMLGDNTPPALIGLSEVENSAVLTDLTEQTALRNHQYRYVISNSGDARGMNVALLYQRDEMKVLSTKEYSIGSQSRTMLHVTAEVVNGDVLDIFVCHFPSRRTGVKKSEPQRIKTAKLLRQKVDSVTKKRKKANIIIMGDFNDYPDNTSMSETLGAKNIKENTKEGVTKNNLYNLFRHRTKEPDFGSYKYGGKWGCLDQFVVSGELLTDLGRTRVVGNEAHIYTADFLLQNDKKGKKAHPTYRGFKYIGGYSDHLPIYMDLRIE